MPAKEKTFTALLCLLALMCLLPFVTPPLALGGGILLALAMGNPHAIWTARAAKLLLGISVAGLGAGMNLDAVLDAGAGGIVSSFCSIVVTMAAGMLLARLLKEERETAILISAGTAICGGSAIAAVAASIRAQPQAVTVALVIVFVLNALALMAFPWIGKSLGLSQHQFGLWAALAIHDTSSVVGATLQYGPEALQTGTTVKLARALWIIPLALVLSVWHQKSGGEKSDKKPSRPWFILWFLVAAALVTWFPALRETGLMVEACARRLLIVTLFLIGTGLTFPALKAAGLRPFIQGISLWIMVTLLMLAAVKGGVIR